MNYDSSFDPSLSTNDLDPSSFQDQDQLRQHLLPTLKNWFTSAQRQVHVLAITPGGGKTYTTAQALVESCHENPGFVGMLAIHTKKRIKQELESIKQIKQQLESVEDTPNYSRHLTHNKTEKNDDLDTLRQKALTRTIPAGMSEKEVKQTQRYRPEAIKIYALKRSAGTCESCNQPTPFRSSRGPYLEVHHMQRLADGGPDEPNNVIAVCPNCHRRTHSSVDKKIFNNDPISKIEQKEDDLGNRG